MSSQARQQRPVVVAPERASATQPLLAGIIENLPGMLFRCRFGDDWRLEFVAGSVRELTGYEPAALLADPPASSPIDSIHPDDQPRFWQRLLEAAKGDGSYTIEYRMRAAGNVEKWVWERGRVIRGADGRAVALEGFTQDITERRRAEQQLMASERLQRLMLDTEPECVKVLAPDGSLREMNQSGLAMLEVGSLAEAQQRPLIDYVDPSHRTAFTELHRRVMQGGSGALEFEIVGARGTRRWLETHAVPMRDDAGAVIALLGVTRDITEGRHQRQRILRLSRMRRVMSSINALIVRTRSRAELFQEACRIAVEQGGFGLAWVGLYEPDGATLAAALHGSDGGHLRGRRFSAAELAAGPAAEGVRAVRAGRAWVRNDLEHEGGNGPWQNVLRQLGFRSAATYPLHVGGELIGHFNLYAYETGFFDEEEQALLAELAGDLAYALEFIIKDERIDYLSLYDALTHLPNRGLFLRRLHGLIETARATSRRLALLMLDMERFKAFNDALGQEGGDALLKLTAERLKFHAGGAGLVARVAGDRFAALIPDLDRGVDVETLVGSGGWDRLDPPFRRGDVEYQTTFKIGIAVFPQDGNDAEALLRNAELALKHGKATGRRRVRYTADMGELAARKSQLSRELRLALERDELQLYYHPKVELRSGRLCGAEALLRWRHAERGLVLPGSFVPLMEETGLIIEVGRWAVAQAMRQRADWLRAGLPVPRIGVNVSPIELREPEYVTAVAKALAGGDAAGLEIEITESMMMSEPDANVARLRALRDLGITVALDDFGTGYSSLAYLARLPLNSVKIDRSFVARLGDDRDTTTIVGAIVSLAHSMDLAVVAEGVETEDQLRLLHALRCDEVQGFLFSEPLPADAFAALLQSGRRLA